MVLPLNITVKASLLPTPVLVSMMSADRKAPPLKATGPLPLTCAQVPLPAQSAQVPLRSPPTLPRPGALAQCDGKPAERQWPQRQHKQQATLRSPPRREQQWGQRVPQPAANGRRLLPLTGQLSPPQATQTEARMAAPKQAGITGAFEPRLHPQRARVNSNQILLSPPNAKDAGLWGGSGNPSDAREVLAPDEGMFEAMLVIVGVMGFILMAVVVIRFLYAAEAVQLRRAPAPSVSALEDRKWKARAATPVNAEKGWLAEENTPSKRAAELDTWPSFREEE